MTSNGGRQFKFLQSRASRGLSGARASSEAWSLCLCFTVQIVNPTSASADGEAIEIDILILMLLIITILKEYEQWRCERRQIRFTLEYVLFV